MIMIIADGADREDCIGGILSDAGLVDYDDNTLLLLLLLPVLMMEMLMEELC